MKPNAYSVSIVFSYLLWRQDIESRVTVANREDFLPIDWLGKA